MGFSDAIRGRREQLGLSLRSVAQEAGVDPAYLSRVESGKVPPSDQLIHELAGVLRWTEDELLLLAGRLPATLRELVAREPRRATTALRNIGAMVAAEAGSAYGSPLVARRGMRAIEDNFPYEEISEIAEVESWRKEIYRPVYHVHKWWAQRLGSVFRAAILGAAAPKGSSILDLFYEPVRLPGLVVFDPFMGSGTTVGEAHKLGCTVIGRDINPVACRAVRTALGPVERRDLLDLFHQLESSIADKIRRLYKCVDDRGLPCDVLYYFWVKVVACPDCGGDVDLFSSYVIAHHAYAKLNPTVQILCPGCGDVFAGHLGAKSVECPACRTTFAPEEGPARRTTAVCGSCRHEFPIARTIRALGKPPEHRLYAKLLLLPDGTKAYQRATEADREAYAAAQRHLRELAPPLPRVEIQDGYNTRQILNYGYRYWHELFNDRQLLALSLLAQAIRDLPQGPGREAMATLFSGVLEFNNMFASYKGEGTGAVRHMFSHHILKPERTPIEANVWGTPKSSGSFSTLFRSRMVRFLDYRETPFEVAVESVGSRKIGRKVFGVCPPMGGPIVSRHPTGGLTAGMIYLSSGDSSEIDIPAGSVDLVITDPPFFDNVHYSELADFFFVWQELYFNNVGGKARCTTRRSEEVQDVDPAAFASKLGSVFRECHRVLKEEGLLVFSYHHSREDGWSALASAVIQSGFTFVQCQPVKSEMSVAAPKSQAKEPIDLDVLLVCRKTAADARPGRTDAEALANATRDATEKVRRFNVVGRRLSRNDVRVIHLSQLLVELSAGRRTPEVLAGLETVLPETRRQVEACWSRQHLPESIPVTDTDRERILQMSLFTGESKGR